MIKFANLPEMKQSAVVQKLRTNNISIAQFRLEMILTLHHEYNAVLK